MVLRLINSRCENRSPRIVLHGPYPIFCPAPFGFMSALVLEKEQWFFLLTANEIDHRQHCDYKQHVVLNELQRV
jgi:hypothetical protein